MVFRFGGRGGGWRPPGRVSTGTVPATTAPCAFAPLIKGAAASPDHESLNCKVTFETKSIAIA